MSRNYRTAKGLICAGVACAFWATLYIDTAFIAPYGTADLAVVRFAFSAFAAIIVLLVGNRIPMVRSELTVGRFAMASALGFLGFTGYYFFLATAIKYNSEIVTVAIIGTISVVTLLLNNIIYREYKWRAIAFPAALGCAGVATIIRYQPHLALGVGAGAEWKHVLGLGSAIVALIMWSAYQVLNRLTLERLVGGSAISVQDWTLLTLIGGSIALPLLIAFLPITPLAGEFVLFAHPLSTAILPLIGWGLFLALGASLISLRAWNESQLLLPPTLSGQSIVFLLPFVFTLSWHYGRFSAHPVQTGIGIALLISSVVFVIVLRHPPEGLPAILKTKIEKLRNEELVQRLI